MIEWPDVLKAGLVAALVLAGSMILGAILTVILVLRMPADYFSRDGNQGSRTHKHPVIRLAGRIAKNLFGVAIVVLGGALSLPGVPGPGLLLVLFGLTLMDVPGKRRLERRLIGRPAILNAINRLRRRWNRPPIVLEPPPSDAQLKTALPTEHRGKERTGASLRSNQGP
jgi:hypothetical protein